MFLQNYFCNESICIRRVRKLTYNVRSGHEGRGRSTPILKRLNYYRITVEYFCMIPFASSR